MDTKDKTYFLLGYEIRCKPSDVNARQHYEYTAMGKTFPTLAKAKQYIRDSLYNGRTPVEPSPTEKRKITCNYHELDMNEP